MPPKKAGDQTSKKTETKQKEKTIEDKTFGLKNKKGAKQQKFIQQVQCQVKGASAAKAKDEEMKKKLEKDKKQKEMDELNALFKCVEQSVPKGVDPKSIICEAFKKAKCTKGDKCKFSHDLNLHRKTEKINAFEDRREAIDATKDNRANDPNRTNIVCKYFVEAVESKKFGWFWVCPNNGDKCQYRHCLPDGYVLKSDKKKDTNDDEGISLEDLVERERAMITDTTKITLKSFLEWKKRKLKEKQEKQSAAAAKRQSDLKDGKTQGMTGVEMFAFNPGMMTGESGGDADEGVIDYTREQQDGVDDINVREINLDEFSAQIIRENEEELERQERSAATSTAGISSSNQETSSSSKAMTSSDQSTNVSSKAGDQQQPSASSPDPVPPNQHLTNGTSEAEGAVGGIEIDEDLFAAEIEDLELEDEDEDEDDES